jgi:fucose permease
MSGTASSLVLALLLATAYGSLFHFLIGGPTRRLLLYILVAWIGFIIGHFVGQILVVNWLKLGPLYLFSASLGAWIALFGSWWLANRTG